ncbi:MAG: UbiX family flavin prenyltransferase [Thermoleophilia bacterium]
MKIFVGITGASGQAYAGRLLLALHAGGHEVTACFSSGAVEVIRAEVAVAGIAGTRRETVIQAFLKNYELGPDDYLRLAAPDDMSSVFASGSSLGAAAIVCPCSMSSLACMAAGITRNLIHRVADVMLKESRPLVLVPRETPISEIHLQNMLRLRRAGGLIVPAMPAFYHQPQSIDDLTDFVVGKALDQLGIEHQLFSRWEG